MGIAAEKKDGLRENCGSLASSRDRKWSICLVISWRIASTSLCIGLSGSGTRVRRCEESSLLHWWHLVRPSLSTLHLFCAVTNASSVLASLEYRSCKFHSRMFNRASTGSGIGSIGVPAGWGVGIFGALEKESRCIRAWRDALRLISRKPIRSPLLKLPLPCLNSHIVESGDPV